MQETPIAILCADLHLTLRPPLCRADKNWMLTQRDYLLQLQKLTLKYNMPASIQPKIPVICGGDIFDRWNPAPELMNFALRFLPDGMISVPGQHDLPNHNIKDLYRSGYGVLKQTGKIVDLSSGLIPSPIEGVTVSGFGWEQEITPPPTPKKGRLQIAVIHQYVWRKGDSYPDAPVEQRFDKMWSKLKGYDVAVFGDNHKGFTEIRQGTTIFNCGGFIRRKSDEIKYVPTVGLLYADGTVQRHALDTSNDRFHEAPEDVEREGAVDISEFIKGLEDLGEEGLDFRAAIKHHLESKKVDSATRKIIWQALEQHD